jgi:hypothetical protein
VKSTSEAKKPSKEDKIIRLTRIKQWYIPADSESYLVLRGAGVALNRFHQDFLPTLKLLTASHGIRGREVNFKDEILSPFLDKVGRAWKKKEHCDCTLGAKTLVFESVKADGFAIAKATIPKLQDVLSKFFARWGYRVTFDYSEHRGKCKLNVEYWFDPERQPIVILEEEADDKPKVQFRLGNLRFTFVFDQYDSKTTSHPLRPTQHPESRPDKTYDIGYVHTMIEISQGGTFTPLHTSRCTYAQLSSVKPLIKALMEVPNHHASNFDESPD